MAFVLKCVVTSLWTRKCAVDLVWFWRATGEKGKTGNKDLCESTISVLWL